MKQKEIVRAYSAISNLYKQQIPLTVSHKLYQLKRKLTPQWEFQIEKERELIDQYKPEVKDGDFKFADKDEAVKFAKEYNDLCNELAEIDVELEEFSKVQIKLDDRLTMSPADVEALEPFVDFVDE